MFTCNGFRLVPRRVWSHEQHFVSRRLLPGRAVRPEHIHFRRAPVLVRQRGERCAPSSFVLRLKRHRFRDGKLLVQATDEKLLFFFFFFFCVPPVVSRRVFNNNDGKKWSSSSSSFSSSFPVRILFRPPRLRRPPRFTNAFVNAKSFRDTKQSCLCVPTPMMTTTHSFFFCVFFC